jgi:hypothetical protein
MKTFAKIHLPLSDVVLDLPTDSGWTPPDNLSKARLCLEPVLEIGGKLFPLPVGTWVHWSATRIVLPDDNVWQRTGESAL